MITIRNQAGFNLAAAAVYVLPGEARLPSQIAGQLPDPLTLEGYEHIGEMVTLLASDEPLVMLRVMPSFPAHMVNQLPVIFDYYGRHGRLVRGYETAPIEPALLAISLPSVLEEEIAERLAAMDSVSKVEANRAAMGENPGAAWSPNTETPDDEEPEGDDNA